MGSNRKVSQLLYAAASAVILVNCLWITVADALEGYEVSNEVYNTSPYPTGQNAGAVGKASLYDDSGDYVNFADHQDSSDDDSSDEHSHEYSHEDSHEDSHQDHSDSDQTDDSHEPQPSYAAPQPAYPAPSYPSQPDTYVQPQLYQEPSSYQAPPSDPYYPPAAAPSYPAPSYPAPSYDSHRRRRRRSRSVKPKVIIVQKVLPLSTTTFAFTG